MTEVDPSVCCTDPGKGHVLLLLYSNVMTLLDSWFILVVMFVVDDAAD